MADMHQIFGRKGREVKYRQNSMDAKSHISLPQRPGGRVRHLSFKTKKLPISSGDKSPELIGRTCILIEDAMKPAEAEASWHRSRDRLSACPANHGDPEWS